MQTINFKSPFEGTGKGIALSFRRRVNRGYVHIRFLRPWCLALFIVALGCDDRFQFLENVNSTPELTIWNDRQSVEDHSFLKDAVKTSLKHNNLPYYIHVAASDRESSISTVSYRILSGTAGLWQGGNALNGGIELIAGEAIVELRPTDIGKVVIEFYVEDDFEKRITAKAEVDVFLNLPPVSSFEAQFKGTTGPYEYMLDASASYDQDAGQGGGIQAYHFVINSTYEITSKTPQVRYNFPGPGPDRRDVKLEVIDSDGAHSEFFPLVVK